MLIDIVSTDEDNNHVDVVKEILRTEKNYLDVLHVVTKVSKAFDHRSEMSNKLGLRFYFLS